MAIWPQTQRPLAGEALRLGSGLAEDAHAHSYFQTFLFCFNSSKRNMINTELMADKRNQPLWKLCSSALI